MEPQPLGERVDAVGRDDRIVGHAAEDLPVSFERLALIAGEKEDVREVVYFVGGKGSTATTEERDRAGAAELIFSSSWHHRIDVFDGSEQIGLPPTCIQQDSSTPSAGVQGVHSLNMACNLSTAG